MKKRTIFFTLLILVLLTIINVYIFVNRNNGFNYIKSLDYKGLYYSNDQLKIEKIKQEKDSVELVLSGKNKSSEWSVFVDSAFKYKYRGNTLRIRAVDGIHKYKIVNEDLKRIVFITADYSSNSLSEKGAKSFYISKSNLSFSDEEFNSIEDWVYASKYANKNETEKINLIINDSIKLDQNLPTLKKIEKISLFLLKKLSARSGIPDSTMKFLSPFRQYELACNQKSKIWCENFTLIYLAFANTAGIPSRYVATNVKVGEQNLGGHVFAESYIKEQNRWAYIDLTSSKIYSIDSDSLVLNAVDVFDIASLNIQTNVKSLVYSNGVVAFKPFDSLNSTERFYFEHNSELIFLYSKQDPATLRSKIFNYLFPNTYYAVYAGNNFHDNFLFYIKVGFVYLWFLTFLFLFFILISGKKHNLTQRK